MRRSDRTTEGSSYTVGKGRARRILLLTRPGVLSKVLSLLCWFARLERKNTSAWEKQSESKMVVYKSPTIL